MRYQASIDEKLGETRIEITSNCYTDAVPMLRTLIFRKQDIDLKSQALPLACALLTARYCGDQFEFGGARIGQDYAEAIRSLLGPRTNISAVDGHHRTLSSGEFDIMVEKAGVHERVGRPAVLADALPIERVDWSGDFVFPRARNSSLHAFGAYQTNAEFFADAHTVSVAIGLLHSRDRCRTIFVPAHEAPGASTLSRVQTALNIVSVSLEPVE